ncbi:hypothetical protein [Flammeovirga sp. OC4]|uniref:hypothetical protein n=1 Tax=Flammeovirga sp. OC4 TaxID=1382345 RepID=UPI0005C7794B|nr:hypothetical protein [Flammeovirga sp. OC4]
MISKRYITLGILFLTSFFSYSQTDSSSKFPSSNNVMIEVNFNPFGDNGVFSFDNVKTKYWINNKTALRLGLQFDYKKNSTTEDDYKPNEENKPTISEKSFLVGFKPGIEFRILQNTRVSSYWGVEFSYVNKSTSSEYVDYYRDIYSDKEEYNTVETKLDGAWRSVSLQEFDSVNEWGGLSQRTYSSTNYTGERAFSSYGLNLILGTDFFIIRHLYLGFEIGLGYEVTNYKEIDLEIIDNRKYNPLFPYLPPRDIEDIKITNPSSTSTDFGFYFNNAIRLGFYF